MCTVSGLESSAAGNLRVKVHDCNKCFMCRYNNNNNNKYFIILQKVDQLNLI